ncbi:hypothetical protein [Rubellicoccus peritrichatus]|uniref:Uncharacterized protein n=1 Tax=Rubellicoccus peritrichatus TaxID=3080537 RepID=A0AAQ3LCW1_9BACT|nr:hypothetical protein [Puniceicoccus sp. CR14]WOO42129.1 hypothetical protein RZN69_03445 [Puniceicoccus sp. CR14]
MDTPPNHSFKSLIKAWLLVTLVFGFTCPVSAQSFENDFGFELSPKGNTLIFAESYGYPGYSEKYLFKEHWRAKGDSESVLTVSIDEGRGFRDSWVTHNKEDGSYATRYYSDPDYNENLLDNTSAPTVIELGVPYSFYRVVKHQLVGDSEPYGTARYDHTRVLESIEVIDTIFGRLPALRFNGETVRILEGDYYTPGTFSWEYTYWVIPGIYEVKGSGFDPETEEYVYSELTETDLNFEPKPLPILDGNNPVWNMFGYTWDMGGGWQESFEFGSLWTDSFPWVWSDDMQSWLYFQGDRKSAWAWVDRTATWIWTNQELYPWVYNSVTFQWSAIGEEG